MNIVGETICFVIFLNIFPIHYISYCMKELAEMASGYHYALLIVHMDIK